VEHDSEYILNTSRSDKIVALGYLCYNLCIDGTIKFPEMTGVVKELKKAMDYLIVLRGNNADNDYLKAQEDNINKMLTELGCICYNLYNDKKLVNRDILNLCDSIASINREISLKNAADIEFIPKQLYQDAQIVDEVSSKPRKTGKMDTSIPKGMEPIPLNNILCICGYRNRFDAVYCARCGVKLK